MRSCLLKRVTLWQKDNLLILTKLFICHTVFKSICFKWVNPFPIDDTSGVNDFLKRWGLLPGSFQSIFIFENFEAKYGYFVYKWKLRHWKECKTSWWKNKLFIRNNLFFSHNGFKMLSCRCIKIRLHMGNASELLLGKHLRTKCGHCDKRKTSLWWAISPFLSMFSTIFNNYINLYTRPVFCCRIAVCGKGLTRRCMSVSSVQLLYWHGMFEFILLCEIYFNKNKTKRVQTVLVDYLFCSRAW